ncbi:MAG: ABC transporter ATP-binding protein [candidate division Zixibacteria bacterium]|nr:ABC transporter ATP-binding protein [candidate division Zixibacteria bacterium]
MNIYTRSFSVLRPYWRHLITASVSAALYALFSGMLVWMAGPLLTTLFNTGDVAGFNLMSPTPTSGTAADSSAASSVLHQATAVAGSLKETMKGWVDDLVSAPDRQHTLVLFCVVIVVVTLLKNLFLYLQGYFMAWVQQSVMKDFRNRLFEKYQRLSLDYFHRRRTGQVMARVTNDVVVLNEAIDIGFNRLVTDGIMAIVFTAFLFILSWKLTLLAMICLPAVFVFIWYIGKKLRRYSERTQERMADVNSVLEENVSNMRIVKAFSMEDFEARKFFRTTYDYFRSLVRMTRIRHLASPINDLLATAAGIIILLYAGSRILTETGELQAGDFMTYVVSMFSLIKPAKELSQIHIKIQEGMAAAERVFEVLDTPETIVDRSHARALDRFEHTIRFEGISFQYDAKEPVLRKIDFEVKQGEVVAVVGPSGAGKTTLFNLLPRFYDPQQGRITIDGNDIKDLSLKSLRGLMGIVTQETYLFHDTIRNNIAYGLSEIENGKVVEAATMANAHEFISSFPEKYETVVGSRGVRLSGGQRQRIAIARALLRDPQILLFDEATSALDTESERLVQEAIDRLLVGRTTLVIAHRLSTIKHADRIIVLDRGEIVEHGSHDELMRREGLYHRLYTMQFRDAE